MNRHVSPPHPLLQAPLTQLEHELLQEKATALGRLGRGLEMALAALRNHDAAACAPQPSRDVLIAAAGHALWMFIVQREACGLRDTAQIVRDYAVPAEVIQRCGAALPPARLHHRLMR